MPPVAMLAYRTVKSAIFPRLAVIPTTLVYFAYSVGFAISHRILKLNTL
jgi:hypothetical protein